MNELHLFAGAGGGILGGMLLGHTCVCAVEIEPYCRRVLLQRQRDGILPKFPIWDDIQTFDGRPWRGIVDIVCGGFPCQDISAAGKGAGINGERSGLWGEMARVVREVGPRYVFVENSPMLTSRGLGRVLGDLAAMGYDARWCVLGAIDAGAPHRRERIWILADTVKYGLESARPKQQTAGFVGGCQNVADAASDRWAQCDEQHDGRMPTATRGDRLREPRGGGTDQGAQDFSDTDGAGCEEQRSAVANGAEHEAAECGDWWRTEPDVGRVANGVASRVDRLRAIGNGQVPSVAALAWRVLQGE